MLLLGATALFSKILPLSAVDITFGRAGIACIMLFGIVKLFKKSILLDSKKDYFLALFLGLLMAAHWVSYFAAMQYSSVVKTKYITCF